MSARLLAPGTARLFGSGDATEKTPVASGTLPLAGQAPGAFIKAFPLGASAFELAYPTGLNGSAGFFPAPGYHQ
jgi:hypothetical protein